MEKEEVKKRGNVKGKVVFVHEEKKSRIGALIILGLVIMISGIIARHVIGALSFYDVSGDPEFFIRVLGALVDIANSVISVGILILVIGLFRKGFRDTSLHPNIRAALVIGALILLAIAIVIQTYAVWDLYARPWYY